MKIISTALLTGLGLTIAWAQPSIVSPHHTIAPTQITATFPPVPLPPQPAFTARSSTPKRITGTFTDSQGRTTKYRYSLPKGMDLSKPQPFLIDFHGNNSGTQEELLDSFFPPNERDAHARGLVAVMVTSPDTKQGTANGTRHWNYDLDRKLIHEFLQRHLPTLFKPDYHRVYFSGASQGTCFLNVFLPKYGEFYKGGFFAGCGCHNYTDPTWTPSQAFIDGMKIYVSSSKGDFLYNSSKKGYEYYKYTIGFDTRADIDKAGSHCRLAWDQQKVALDWMTGKTTIADVPFKPYWKRVSAKRDVDMALLDNGKLIKASYDEKLKQSTLYHSQNQGETWQQQSVIKGELSSIHPIGQVLYGVLNDKLHQSHDGGKTFTLFDATSKRTIFKTNTDGQSLYFSSNYGAGWINSNQQFAPLRQPDIPFLKVLDTHAIDKLPVAGGVLLGDSWSTSRSNKLFFYSSDKNTYHPIALPSEGKLNALAWDGSQLYATKTINKTVNGETSAFFDGLLRSNDWGANWTKMSLPDKVVKAIAGENLNIANVKIAVLADNALLLYSDNSRSPLWIGKEGGSQWTPVIGFLAYKTKVIANHRATYLANKKVFSSSNSPFGSPDGGVFRLVLKSTDENPAPISPAKQYKITITSPTNGLLNCNKTTAIKNDTVTCKAKPNPGYQVDTWGSVCQGQTGLSCQFTVTGNSTVSVLFKAIPPKQYQIIANPPTNGLLSCDKTTAIKNDTVTCKAKPNSGYQVDTWGGVCQGQTGLNCQFTVTDVSTVSVLFKAIPPKQYQITVNQPTSGSLSCDKTTAIKNGTVTCKAKPNQGYQVDTWGGVCQGQTGLNCQFTVTGDSTVSLSFKQQAATHQVIFRESFETLDP